MRLPDRLLSLSLLAILLAQSACGSSDGLPPTIQPHQTPNIPPTLTPYLLPTALPTPDLQKEQLRILRKDNQNASDLLRDKPLMQDADFERIAGSLQQSPGLLLKKFGNGLRQLWSTPNRPTYLPSWMSSQTFPLVVTYDTDPISLCAIEGQFGPEYIYKRTEVKTGNETRFPRLASVRMGIHLGSPQFSRQEGTVAESLYLAKEFIQLVSTSSVVPQMVPIFRQMGYEFSALQTGKPITDSLSITEMGLITLLWETTKDSSTAYVLTDGFPALIVASQLESLVNRGLIPQTSRALMPFYQAYNLMNQPRYVSAKNKVYALAAAWANSRDIPPPSDYLRVMLDKDVFALIIEMQALIK